MIVYELCTIERYNIMDLINLNISGLTVDKNKLYYFSDTDIGQHPIDVATNIGNYKLVKFLIIKDENLNYKFALKNAILNKDELMVQLLYNSGIDTCPGDSPFFEACKTGYMKNIILIANKDPKAVEEDMDKILDSIFVGQKVKDFLCKKIENYINKNFEDD